MGSGGFTIADTCTQKYTCNQDRQPECKRVFLQLLNVQIQSAMTRVRMRAHTRTRTAFELSNTISLVVAGISGFGRGRLSMSFQLSPPFGNIFAYCIQSHKKKSKWMLLGDKVVLYYIPLNYNPFLINFRTRFYPYSLYYYIVLNWRSRETFG